MHARPRPFGNTREPALDGLRALAVGAVLAFHSGADWARGGYLGVSLFLTLSGFLICGLLLADHQRGRWSPANFWVRRAKRLLPAALLTLAVIAVVSRWVEPGLHALKGDIVSALLYVANWRFILDGQAYGDLFSAPSPVLHFWSLAVEEQFYIVFPLLLLGLTRVVPGQKHLGLVLGAVALASGLAPTVLDLGADRAYYGTDTRAAELLIGAVLATVTVVGGTHRRLQRWRWPHELLALGCIVGLGYFWATLDQTSDLLFRGGLMVHAALTCGLIVAALQPGSIIQRMLRLAPLAWLGRISYGIYLFHWPLFVWLTPARTGLDGPALHASRVSLAVLLAAASFHLIEQPALRSKRIVVPAVAGGLVAALIGLVLVATPSPDATTQAVDFDVAVAARPESLAGSTFTEIASSAEAAASDLSGSTDAHVDDAGESPGKDAQNPGLQLTRPPEGLAVSDALAIAGATGDAFDDVAPPLVNEGKAFDYDSAAPKIVVFGDSSALMLGFGLGDWGRATGEAQFLDLASIGCGLSRGGLRSVADQKPYDKDTACGDWAPAFESLRLLLEPDAVVFNFGLWEVVDHLLPGDDQWRAIGDPVFDHHLRQEIREASQIFTDRGVPVVWATSPQLALSLQSPRVSGEPYPSDDPLRVEALNALVVDEATRMPLAGFVDLHAWFDALEEGPLDPSVRPDGVHVTHSSSATVGQWLGPEIMAELARILDADG